MKIGVFFLMLFSSCFLNGATFSDWETALKDKASANYAKTTKLIVESIERQLARSIMSYFYTFKKINNNYKNRFFLYFRVLRLCDEIVMMKNSLSKKSMDEDDRKSLARLCETIDEIWDIKRSFSDLDVSSFCRQMDSARAINFLASVQFIISSEIDTIIQYISVLFKSEGVNLLTAVSHILRNKSATRLSRDHIEVVGFMKSLLDIIKRFSHSQKIFPEVSDLEDFAKCSSQPNIPDFFYYLTFDSCLQLYPDTLFVTELIQSGRICYLMMIDYWFKVFKNFCPEFFSRLALNRVLAITMENPLLTEYRESLQLPNIPTYNSLTQAFSQEELTSSYSSVESVRVPSLSFLLKNKSPIDQIRDSCGIPSRESAEELSAPNQTAIKESQNIFRRLYRFFFSKR